ncbi:hypothetical protein ACF09E_34830 [Streptomyces sp. NPDC014891]|uniref:hypothetical protein n=1 Tax=Streptomyces sp. NPDC014891 TaxID=3364929 RepID=UPI0036F8982F
MSRTRGTWSTAGIWLGGTALVAVLALTGLAVMGGDGEAPDAPAKGGPSASAPATPSSGAEPTYDAPDDWTEPERWVALPRGARQDEHGSPVGFPHTTEGAAAMLAATNTTSIEGETWQSDELMRVFRSYSGAEDQTERNRAKVQKSGEKTDAQLAREMGVSPGSPLPAGAYVRSTVVGYQVITSSPDEVAVWSLSRVVQKKGELEKEQGSYTRTLVAAQWQDGDWKMTGPATLRALKAVEGKPKPKMVAPGDAEYNAAGWTAIREAS